MEPACVLLAINLVLIVLLAIACKIDKQQFMTMYSVIIAFYFGTQVQKKQDSANDVKESHEKG